MCRLFQFKYDQCCELIASGLYRDWAEPVGEALTNVADGGAVTDAVDDIL